MLHMALVFLVIGLIAALLGFTTIAGASIVSRPAAPSGS